MARVSCTRAEPGETAIASSSPRSANPGRVDPSLACRMFTPVGYFLVGLRRLAAVALEGPGRGELAELVADHVLGHVQLDEVPPVVDGEVLAHELGHDRAGPRPDLDRFAAAGESALYTFSSNRSTTYGPFLSERPMDVP